MWLKVCYCWKWPYLFRPGYWIYMPIAQINSRFNQRIVSRWAIYFSREVWKYWYVFFHIRLMLRTLLHRSWRPVTSPEPTLAITLTAATGKCISHPPAEVGPPWSRSHGIRRDSKFMSDFLLVVMAFSRKEVNLIFFQVFTPRAIVLVTKWHRK